MKRSRRRPPSKLATNPDESLPEESDDSELSESSLELSESLSEDDEAEGVTINFSPDNISVHKSVSSDDSTALVEPVFASLSPEDDPPDVVVPEVPELDVKLLVPDLLEIT